MGREFGLSKRKVLGEFGGGSGSICGNNEQMMCWVGNPSETGTLPVHSLPTCAAWPAEITQNFILLKMCLRVLTNNYIIVGIVNSSNILNQWEE